MPGPQPAHHRSSTLARRFRVLFFLKLHFLSEHREVERGRAERTWSSRPLALRFTATHPLLGGLAGSLLLLVRSLFGVKPGKGSSCHLSCWCTLGIACFLDFPPHKAWDSQRVSGSRIKNGGRWSVSWWVVELSRAATAQGRRIPFLVYLLCFQLLDSLLTHTGLATWFLWLWDSTWWK